MIRHVWFDFAGTLYKETPELQAARDVVRYSEYAKITHLTDLDEAKNQYDALLAEAGSNSAVFSSLGKPDDYWQRISEGVDLTAYIKPDPVITETLRELSSSLPISIFTNFRLQRVTRMLQTLEISPQFFTHVLTGDNVQARKPDLDGFKQMIVLSEVPANEIIYIGDRVSADVAPAKVLGIVTCLVWQQSVEADYSTVDFSRLPEIIRQAV